MELSGKKILIVRLSALGDVIFNIPLANALKKAGATVHWVVCEKGFDIIKNNPCVDKVIFAPLEKWKKEKNKIKNWFEFWKIECSIRAEKYDIVLDTQMLFKCMFWTMFSGAKKRLAGSDGKEFSKFGATDIVKIPSGWKMNVVDKYLLFAKYLGIEGNSEDMTLPSFESNICQGIHCDKPLAIICPSTTWKTKHWDKDNFKELVQKLKDRFNIVLTGTNKDYDYIEYINSGVGTNLAGKTSLMDLLELFKKAEIVISLDSGSTHLARAARAKSIVSIFCSTPESYYEPIGEKYRSIGGNLDCRPCHKRKCRINRNNPPCTKLPDTEEVLKIIDELVER